MSDQVCLMFLAELELYFPSEVEYLSYRLVHRCGSLFVICYIYVFQWA